MNFIFYLFICTWNTGGNPVVVMPGDQINPHIVMGWFGDAFIVWEDTDVSEIYLTSISNGLGNFRWANPLNVSGSVYKDRYPDIISDDVDGSCIVVWAKENSSGEFDIYAKRINKDGVVLWEIPVCSASGNQDNPLIEQDRLWAANKVIIVWEDFRSGKRDIYAQRIKVYDGTAEWGSNGKLLFSGAKLFDVVETVRQIFIFYEDTIIGEYKVSLIDEITGNIIWTKTVLGELSLNSLPINSSSGVGSVLIPYRVNNNEWGLMHIKSDYSIVFDVTVVQATYEVPLFNICRVGSNVMVFYVKDTNGNSNYILCAKLYDYYGNMLWNNEKIIDSLVSLEGIVSRNPYNDTTVLVVYTKKTDRGNKIVAQRISESGNILWTKEALLSSADSMKFLVERRGIIGDNYDGAIVVWKDKRNGDFDVYAMRVRGNGSTDFEPPIVNLIYPVEGETLFVNDTVIIKWSAQDNDTLLYSVVKYSTDGGGTWVLIDSSYYSADSILWIVPNNPTSWAQVMVRVYDASGNVNDDVSGFFIIKPVYIKESSFSPVRIPFPLIFSVFTVDGRKVNKELMKFNRIYFLQLKINGKMIKRKIIKFKKGGIR